MLKKKFLFIIFIFTLVLDKLYCIDPPKDIYIEDIIIGNKDNVAKTGDTISVHYKGWLFDRNAVQENYCDAKGIKFDDSTDKKFREKYGDEVKEFTFPLGQGLVITGWELGFKNMREGGKRCLVIPPKFGYGARKIGDLIPANSTLIFEINLISIKNKED